MSWQELPEDWPHSVLDTIGGGRKTVWSGSVVKSLDDEAAYDIEGFLFSRVHCQPARRTNLRNAFIGRANKEFIHAGSPPDDGALVGKIRQDLNQFQIVKELDDDIIAELTAIHGAANWTQTLRTFYPGSLDRRDWKKIKTRINENLDRLKNVRVTFTVTEEGAMGSALGWDAAVEYPEDRIRFGRYNVDPETFAKTLIPYAEGYYPPGRPGDFPEICWIPSPSNWPGEPNADQWGQSNVVKEWHRCMAKLVCMFDWPMPHGLPDAYPTETYGYAPTAMFVYPSGGQGQVRCHIGWGGATNRSGNIIFRISRDDGLPATWQDLVDYFGFDLSQAISISASGGVSGNVQFTGPLGGQTLNVPDTGYIAVSAEEGEATVSISETLTGASLLFEEPIYYLPWEQMQPGARVRYAHLFSGCGFNGPS